MIDCSHIEAPSGEELLQFALEADALPGGKRRHLEHCALCQQRLKDYLRFDEALTTRFYRRLCPDGTQLSLYCENLLSPSEQIRVANHVLDCPLCQREVADTRHFLRATQQEMVVPAAAPPLAALRRSFGVLTKQQAQLVARGERSAHVWPRQYHIDGTDLSLHLSRASSGEQMLLGILTSADNAESIDIFAGADAELYAGQAFADLALEEAPCAHTQVDDLGNLLFRPISGGDYTLIIHVSNHDLIVEHIRID